MRQGQASASFFVKKEAKKLHPFCAAPSTPMDKSFLLLFFKKEALPSFLPGETHG
jgi:hypothetical protein